MVRIGILTYFASINYGAFLQAYALQECLKSRYGDVAEVEIINYEARTAHEFYLKYVLYADRLYRDKLIGQYNRFLESRNSLRLSEEELVTDHLKEVERFLQGKYNIIIAGSDEIWRTDSFRGFPTAYWLNYNLADTTYMAYAVSGRSDFQKLTDGMQKYIKDSVKRFCYIGTRDEVTKKELLKITDQEIDRNCDPVFLMPELFRINNKEKIRRRVIEKYGLKTGRPLVSLMLPYNEEAASQLYRMLQYDNLAAILYRPVKGIKDYNFIELSPFEWSDMIGISDLVITDRFHGTVFSMLHGIPFIAVECGEKGRGKIENLLIENFMTDKMLYQKDYIGNNRKLAVDLYTKGRKTMKDHMEKLFEQTVQRETEKSRHFFEILDRIIGNQEYGR